MVGEREKDQSNEKETNSRRYMLLGSGGGGHTVQRGRDRPARQDLPHNLII